jgi:hypothetical protein
MDERCARCGKDGGDRRTLWMACLYEMNELHIPFEKVSVKEDGMDRGRSFYTLRVCKECRADWMAAIQWWFMIGKAKEKAL